MTEFQRIDKRIEKLEQLVLELYDSLRGGLELEVLRSKKTQLEKLSEPMRNLHELNKQKYRRRQQQKQYKN